MTGMAAQQYYANAIWTHHALERLRERRLSQDMAAETFMYPDTRLPGKQPGTTEFRKRYDRSLVTIIAKQNDRGEWIILSCWIDPPLPGTHDEKKRTQYTSFRKDYKKAGFWGKFLLEFKRQIGLR